MDIFPTLLTAAGVDLNQYELDGKNILPMVIEGKNHLMIAYFGN